MIELETAERRGFEHDVMHQLGTLTLLAELIRDASDVETESGMRARQLVIEARWLELLLRTEHGIFGYRDASDHSRRIRLDLAVRDLLATSGLLADTRIRLETEPITVQAHRVSLGRALRNLIWNALNAAGSGGEVAVRVRTDGSSAAVSIEDNGPGIPSGADEPVGTGLSVIREVISAAGGALRMENRIHGCTVTLTLPLVAGSRPCAS